MGDSAHDNMMLETVKSFKRPKLIKMLESDKKALHDFCCASIKGLLHMRIATSYLVAESSNLISKEILIKLSDECRVRGMFPGSWSEDMKECYFDFKKVLKKYLEDPLVYN